jgi:hypothetical protein
MNTEELTLEEQRQNLLYKSVLTSLNNIDYICKN